MWKNSLKNVESDKNKILYETLLEFLQRNGTYFMNKPCIKIRKKHCWYTDNVKLRLMIPHRKSSRISGLIYFLKSLSE